MEKIIKSEKKEDLKEVKISETSSRGIGVFSVKEVDQDNISISVDNKEKSMGIFSLEFRMNEGGKVGLKNYDLMYELLRSYLKDKKLFDDRKRLIYSDNLQELDFDIFLGNFNDVLFSIEANPKKINNKSIVINKDKFPNFFSTLKSFLEN